MPCLTPVIRGYAPNARCVRATVLAMSVFDSPVSFTCGVSRDFFALDIFRADSLIYLLIKYSMRDLG